MAADACPASWLTRSAGEFGTVHSLVPDVFEAYARVFHPAALADREVRWADVARANGREMHASAEWGSIVGSWQLEGQPGLWDAEPSVGRTPERVARRLAEVLAEYTGAVGQCWFGLWEGWGEPNVMMFFREGTPLDVQARIQTARQMEAEAWPAFVARAPRFNMPHRPMLLLRGRLSEIRVFYDGDTNPPSIWWPEDRAWCVGGDVDLMTTYLGASRSAVEAIVGDPELEALAIPSRQRVTWEADAVNPLPAPPFG